MKSIKSFYVLILFLAVVATGCKIILNSSRSLRASDFSIGSEISGWKEEQGSYTTFNDPQSLQALMDGGYNIYTDNGMIEGIQQVLITSDERRNQAWIMDFGSVEKATDEYNLVLKNKVTRKLLIPGYGDTTALCKPVLGGVTVYAHFNAFYFELGITGYASQKLAIDDALFFLDFYKNKANEQ